MNQVAPKKHSMRRITATVVDDEVPVLSDPQVERMQAVTIAATALETKEEYVREIGRLWEQAQHRFIEIGNYLIFAKEKLKKYGEYERMISEELPFQRSVAHALRAVAMAVREGRIDRQELPNSYSTAYLLTSLDDDGLEEARTNGLVSPEVRRSTVAEFCKTYRMRSTPNVLPTQSKLIRERDALLRRKKLIDERLEQIERILNGNGAGAAILIPPDNGRNN